MIFDIFKHKKTYKPKEFEGRFISDCELSDIINSMGKPFFSDESRDIKDMFNNLKKMIGDGRK